jgi:hypothetical protein
MRNDGIGHARLRIIYYMWQPESERFSLDRDESASGVQGGGMVYLQRYMPALIIKFKFGIR